MTNHRPFPEELTEDPAKAAYKKADRERRIAAEVADIEGVNAPRIISPDEIRAMLARNDPSLAGSPALEAWQDAFDARAALDALKAIVRQLIETATLETPGLRITLDRPAYWKLADLVGLCSTDLKVAPQPPMRIRVERCPKCGVEMAVTDGYELPRDCGMCAHLAQFAPEPKPRHWTEAKLPPGANFGPGESI